MRSATIAGDGLAARAIAGTLSKSGWSLAFEPGPMRTKPAAIEVDPVTADLLRELVPQLGPALDNAFILDGRLVRWGPEASFSFVPGRSRALSLSADDWPSRDWPLVRSACSSQSLAAPSPPPGGWRVDAVASKDEREYDMWGARHIVQARLTCPGRWPRPVSEMLGRPDGWLYLLPISPSTIYAQLSVPRSALDRAPSEELIERALRDLGAPWLATLKRCGETQVHATAPRLARRLISRRAIAIGGAAARFDPLCSQGLGSGLRMSLLAAASLEAIESGMCFSSVRDHYRNRLHRHFGAHLRHCAHLYASGEFDDSWGSELDATIDGASAMTFTEREAGSTPLSLNAGTLVIA